jgi:hypothetical protein
MIGGVSRFRRSRAITTLIEAVQLVQARSSRRAAGPVTSDERKQIIDLYRAGTKVAGICRATGRSRYAIYAVLNDEGIDHRKDRSRFLVVDHDHQTSQVRALLCWNCNCGLGHFRENAEIMRAAIRYVEAPAALTAQVC